MPLPSVLTWWGFFYENLKKSLNTLDKLYRLCQYTYMRGNGAEQKGKKKGKNNGKKRIKHD